MNKKIFIIEDNPDLIDIYTQRFQDAGFDVQSSQNGLDAVVLLGDAQEEQPDLILLDIMMPEMNGYEVLESITNNFDKNKQDIPIIVWSNLSQDSDIQQAMEKGADLFLTKSDFSGDDLIQEVIEFLEEYNNPEQI